MFNCTHEILVRQFFSHHDLVTREAATAIMQSVKEHPCDVVNLDFAGIDFISRSFADQFHKEKMLLWENGEKEIIVLNAHNDVFQMFNAVANTQTSDNSAYKSFSRLNFESMRSLKEYLQGV